MRALPKLKELSKKHADQGLVIIGIHSKRGAETMAAFAEKHAIPFPLVVDTNDRARAAYRVDGNPDYHLIDRSGKLRVADLANGDLERAVGILLAEPVPNSIDPALAKASQTATFKDKRMLVLFGTEAERTTVTELTKGDRAFGKLLSNEFEIVELDPAHHTALATRLGVTGGTSKLIALDSKGAVLGSHSTEELKPSDLRAFLETHRVPAKNAEELWASALKQAQAENKRILVHLGAPW